MLAWMLADVDRIGSAQVREPPWVDPWRPISMLLDVRAAKKAASEKGKTSASYR